MAIIVTTAEELAGLIRERVDAHATMEDVIQYAMEYEDEFKHQNYSRSDWAAEREYIAKNGAPEYNEAWLNDFINTRNEENSLDDEVLDYDIIEYMAQYVSEFEGC